MNYEFFINWFAFAITCCVFVFLAFSFYYLAYLIEACRKPKKFPTGEKKYKYAVLIPARNEDKVIANILKSLKAQDYPAEYFDVYVIIESKDDPTYNITKSFGYNVVVRKNLVNRRTKGFALQEAIEEIWQSGKEYDSVIIFDADNIMNKDFISLLNDVKNQGYQIGVGYRNFTNATENWVSSCSATLFAFMNQFTSKGRSKYLKKATLTGTGYYVDMQVIHDAGGWIWTGFTEDVELTTYSYYHDVSMHYYPYAMYYDEQPTSRKVLHNQHIRWVWGFIGNKKKFKKGGVNYHTNSKFVQGVAKFEYNFSIWPFVMFIITCLLSFLTMFVLLICTFVDPVIPHGERIDASMWVGFHMLFYFSLLYLSFIIAAIIPIALDNKNLKFPPKVIAGILISYMFFFGDFLYAFLDGAVHKKKRTVWKAIEHKGNIVDKQAIEANTNEEK